MRPRPLTGSASRTILPVSFHPDLDFVVTCTDDGPYVDPAERPTSTLRMWDLERRQVSGRAVTAHEHGAIGVALTELDGQSVAVTVGRSDSSIRVWALTP